MSPPACVEGLGKSIYVSLLGLKTYVLNFSSIYHIVLLFIGFLYSNLLSFFFFCLDVAQGHMKGAPNETRTHSCRFASRAC